MDLPKGKTCSTTNVIQLTENTEARVWQNVKCSFAARRYDHNAMLISMNQSNQDMTVFMPTMTWVGIALYILGNYVLICFYEREELRNIWFACILFFGE